MDREDVTLDRGEIVHLVMPLGTPMAQMIQAQATFHDLLREVSRAVAGTPDDPVTWVVDRVTESSVDYALTPVPVAKVLPEGALHRMVEAVPSGIAALKAGSDRPRYFNDRALALTSNLMAIPTSRPIRTRNGAGEVEITKAASIHAQRILAQPYLSEFGTVEGRLEQLNVHGGHRQFVIFDDLTGARISCQFAHRVPSATIAAGIERRVAVTGEIRSRETGEILSVLVDSNGFRVLPLDDDLPSSDDVLGIFAR